MVIRDPVAILVLSSPLLLADVVKCSSGDDFVVIRLLTTGSIAIGDYPISCCGALAVAFSPLSLFPPVTSLHFLCECFADDLTARLDTFCSLWR